MHLNRLSFRLALWMVCATALLQLGHGLYRYSVDIPLAQAKGIEELNKVVSSIQPALSESLYQYNESLADQLLKTFKSYESVQAVWLTDEENEGIGAWLRDDPIHYEEWEERKWPIEFEGELIGHLVMSVQWRSARIQAEKEVWNIIGFSILMGIISLILLYWVAQFLVAHPISKMSDFLTHLNTRKMHEADISPLSEVRTQAELHLLQSSLNDILLQLCQYLEEKHKTMELLQGFNESLELEVKKRTEELLVAKDKAESASRSKTDFLNTMTHELRTPLNSIMGFSSILIGQDLPERLQKLTKNIHTSGDQLLRLINDIIDYVSLESTQLQVQVFSVFDVLQSVNQEASEEAFNKGLEFQQFVNDQIVMKGDPKRLAMVLRHLLNNAVKFTETGSVTIECKMEGEDKVLISVTDTGIGIDTDNVKALSHAFSQSEQGLDRSKEGVGLGLAIVERVISKWLGTLSFANPEEGGTEVRVLLPLELDASQQSKDAAINPTQP